MSKRRNDEADEADDEKLGGHIQALLESEAFGHPGLRCDRNLHKLNSLR